MTSMYAQPLQFLAQTPSAWIIAFNQMYATILKKRDKSFTNLGSDTYVEFVMNNTLKEIEEDFISSGGVDLITNFLLSNEVEKIDCALVLINYTAMHFPRVCKVLGSNEKIVKKIVSFVFPYPNTRLLSLVHTDRSVADFSIADLRFLSATDDAHEILINNKVLKAVVADLASKEPLNALASMLTIANIIGTSEAKENSQLVMSEDILGELLEALKLGVYANRLTLPLALFPALRKLSINDQNKVQFVNRGVAPIWISKLNNVIDDELVLGEMLEMMLNLSMLEENVASLIGDGVVDAVKNLENSPSVTPQHKKLIEQILWKLGAIKIADNKTKGGAQTSTAEPSAVPSVMISYNWDNQPVVVELANRLKAQGINVWLDLDEMVGSSIEAMAHAVESSQVVLVCMTRKYKESANCRLEGEYAFRRRKPIIPLMMQQNYDADGWLGAIVGTKIYYTVTDVEQVETAVKGVMKELAKLGLVNTAPAKTDVAHSLSVSKLKPVATSSAPPPASTSTTSSSAKSASAKSTSATSSLPAVAMNSEPISWSVTQVGEWLERSGLGKYKEMFYEQNVGGMALAYLAKSTQRKVSPLRSHFTIEVAGTLKFDNSGDYLCFLFQLENLFFQ